MTDYGDTSGFIIMATATTGSAGSESPSGDKIYLWCPDVMGPFQSAEKITQNAGGSSFGDASGKRDLRILFRNCFLVKYGAHATNTAAFNAYLHLLYTYSLKTAPARLYLFVKNTVDNVYLKISWNSSGTQLQYMKGKPQKFPWKMLKGNLYVFEQIEFLEVTN